MSEPFFWFAARRYDLRLPPVEQALEEPNGLLAADGDLEVATLLQAYRQGVFPWYQAGQPILWWTPDPRCVLFPEELRLSRSLRKRLRQGCYQVSFDTAFGEVLRACAEPREEGGGTWLTAEMVSAYERLHRAGYAHSVECREGDALVGGLYGIALGRVFFGESMFARRTDASKVALAHLVARLRDRGFRLIDCQVYSPHLESLGARLLGRAAFMELLLAHQDGGDAPGAWTAEPGKAP